MFSMRHSTGIYQDISVTATETVAGTLSNSESRRTIGDYGMIHEWNSRVVK